MNILITGGTGFIGQLFIRHHTEHQYWVLSRKPSKAEKLFARQAHVKVFGSLDELDNLDDFDAVINLAGEPIIDRRWSPAQKQRIQASRWATTDALVELINNSHKPPEVMLSGSAIGFYGDHGERPVDEVATVQHADFSSQLCAEWERRAEKLQTDTRLVLLRTGVVLHQDFGALKRMLPPFKLGLGGPISDGRHYMAWIHWRDMIGAMARLLTDKSAHGPFNMTAPEPVTNASFSKELGKALHRPAFFPVPALMLKLLLGEAACLLLISQRVMPERLISHDYLFQFPTIDKAFEDLLS